MVPPFLYDIMRVMLLLTGPAAFVCLLNAGISLRKEGGTVFWVGGGFSKWMLWAVIFLALEPTLTWFQFFGVPVFFPPGAAIGNAVAGRYPAGHHNIRQPVCCRADRTGCCGVLCRARRARYRKRHRTVTLDSERDVSARDFEHPCAARRVDTGGKSILDRGSAGIDVELSGEPHHANRRGPGDLRRHPSVCF